MEAKVICGTTIFQTEHSKMSIEDFKNLYIKNKMLFDKESPKVLVNNKNYLTPQNVFHMENFQGNLYVWYVIKLSLLNFILSLQIYLCYISTF